MGRLILEAVACLFGYDPLERPYVFHWLVPRVQVAPRFRSHTPL